MNKKLFKIFFLVFASFLSFNFVYAADGALECAPTGKKVDIEKDGIKPTGWKAKLPICAFKTFTGNYSDAGGFDSLSAAWQHRHDKTVATFEAADGKSTENTEVEVCSDPKAQVKVVVSCKQTKEPIKAKKETSTSTWMSNDCGEGCTELTSSTYSYKCKCSKTDTYYTCNGNTGYKEGDTCCEEGFSEKDGNCVKIETFTATIEAHDGKVEDLKTGENEGEKPTPGKGSNGETDYGKFDENHGTGWECDSTYTLQCPIYVCTKEYPVLETCVPTYKLPDGSPAYCVNPSNGFNGEYQVDDDFDVNKCASSNSTIDCGYANILIEGEWHRLKGEKVEDEAINLAMRIWGAHSGQSGYNKTGVANRKGCNCYDPVIFLTEGNEYVNIYRYLKNYLKEHFEEIAYKYDYIPPNGQALGTTDYNGTLTTLPCDVLGITCGERVCSSQTGGGNDIIYKKAIDLYFNTLIGNKDMKSHLNEIVGIEDTEPEDVTVIVGEETPEGEKKIWLDIEYDRFGELELSEVVYDCDNLDGVSEKDKEIILPYCKTEFRIYDAAGNPIVDDPIKIDECRKGSGCVTKEFTYAIVCNESQPVTHFKIVAKYQDNGAPGTIQKYQSCANPNVNQVMFGVIRDRLDDDEEGPRTPGEPTYFEPEVTTSTKTFDRIYACVDSNCSETGTNLSENFGGCAVKDENNNITYTNDKTYSNYIKDPSLKCITNMVTSTKKMYDYSEHFGVNSNLCKIYCSDEVEFVLANKINATAGETFAYDIEVAAYRNDTRHSDHLLSTVIKERRTCASEIYYTKDFPSDVADKIKQDYGLTAEEVTTSTNIAGLLRTLATRSQSSEGGRKEVVNQILFDLYNCNIYKDAFDSKIKTPKNSANARVGKNGHKYAKVYDYAKYLYDSDNNYGINQECKINPATGENTCINMKGVSYGFGGETETSKINFVRLKSAGDSVKAGGITNIMYCKDTAGGHKCFEMESKPKQDYDYNKFNNWSNDSAFANVTLFGSSYKVPTNDYAMFDVSVSAGMYNMERYQTKPGSGYVIDLAVEEKDDRYLTIDPYQYTVSKNALTDSGCTQINATIVRCDISQVLGASETGNNTMIYTYYRNIKNDEFFRRVNSSDNVFKCVVDVKVPQVSTCKNCDLEIATLYRNVNESKLFPNGVLENSNWATVEGQIAANTIEATSDMLRSGDNLLQYRVTLTPDQIRALKEYNDQNRDFTKEFIDQCYIVDDTYRNCKSNFLEILRGNTTELGSTKYATLDPEYNGTRLFGD